MYKNCFALAVAAALSTFAQASDVQIYGVVDTGLTVSRPNHGGDTKVEMSSGNYAGSRFGFRGSEKLSEDLTVSFILEAGFDSTTGASSEPGKLFNRESQLALEGNWGKAGFGRVGAFSSGSSSLSMYWDMDAFGTGYIDAGIQATQVNVWSLHSNTIYYISPSINGLKLAAQYAINGSQDEEAAAFKDNNPFVNVVARYDGSDWKAIAGFEADYQDDGYKDAYAFKLAGAKKIDHAELYAGYSFYTNYRKFADSTWDDDASVQFNDSGKGLQAHSAYLGLKYTIGKADLLAQYQYMNGKNKGALEGARSKYTRHAIGVGCHYNFSARTMGYLIASYAKGTGLLNEEGNMTNRAVGNVGLTHYF